MRNLILNKWKLITFLFSAMLLICTAGLMLSSNFYASANYTAQTNLVLPKTQLEYRNLTSPIDAYSNESVTAIVESTPTTQSVSIYYNGNYTTLTGTYNISNTFNTFTALNQVKKLDNDTLLITNQALISAINLDDDIKATEIEDTNNNSIRGNYFDTNENYLVIGYGTNAFVYSYENGVFTMQSDSIPNVKGNAPITINNNGDILFVNGQNYISRTSVSNIKTFNNLIEVSPDAMIADNENLYYIYNDEIYRLSLTTNNPQPQKLTVNSMPNYQLGNIENPVSLSFKGSNLLITDDTLHAIQEFKITGDKLEFTGFAIAENKTAFNRISKSVIDVEKYGENIATLDGNKLSIIRAENSEFDAYDKKFFNDYFAIDLSGEMPGAFALGNNSVLLSYKHNSSLSELRILDIENDNLSSSAKVFEGNIIRDLCYQSGKYYILADDGNHSSRVYSCEENSLEFELIIDQVNFLASQLCVDVFGNIFLVNEDNTQINKYQQPYNSQNLDTITYSGKATKLLTDLGGALFMLKDKSVEYLDKNDTWQIIDLQNPPTDDNANAISFAMDFINKSVYIVYANNEGVCKTTDLPNFALTDIAVPTEYITTAENADVNEFKAFSPKQNANVYSVNKGMVNFEFNELVNEREQYALICEIIKTDLFDREIKFYALAGQNNVVLINAKECESVEVQFDSAPEKAYITTAVHFYYLPISTPTDEYALSNTEKIRVAKETCILPQKTFVFLNRSFYYATVIIDGTSYSGYVPKDFTVEVLAENFEWDNYTVETVNTTDVYAEKDLINSLGVLQSGTQIRLFESEGNVSKIAYKSGDNWIIGYIKSSAIQDNPSIAIRNILIILAVAACVCGTTTYFVLRRKVYR